MHPITHNSAGRDEDFLSDGDANGEFPNSLQADPQGLGAGLTLALAPEKTTEAGDSPHHLVQRGRRFGRWAALGHDPGGLPCL
jgi:hypothetical protein